MISLSSYTLVLSAFKDSLPHSFIHSTLSQKCNQSWQSDDKKTPEQDVLMHLASKTKKRHYRQRAIIFILTKFFSEKND